MGGHLMWTAVARNIRKRTDKICVPLDGYNFCKSDIFYNNPNFSFNGDFHLDLSLPKTNYVKKDGERIEFSCPGKHAIEHALNFYGIKNDIDLKCEIYLTEEEKFNSNLIKNLLPKKYACIEPHSKISWSQARSYSFDKYQNIVNALRDKIQFVQIGAAETKKLDNVIYTNGDLTFRETQLILDGADFFLSSEGGLVHLANSCDTKSFVIFSSFHTYPEIFHYPKNTMIDIALFRHEIGGFKNHPLHLEEVEKHNESLIIDLIKKEEL